MSEDHEWFWHIVDAGGLADLPSDEPAALQLLVHRLSQRDARIAELERGVSMIAEGRTPPDQHGHYLAHREAVRIARALLSPAVEGGGGERNSSSVAESAATGGPTPAATSAAPSGEEEALRRAGYDRQMDITEALMGPHEWGYRDPVEGGWIDDYTPFAAAELITHLREQVEVHHAVNRHWEARHRMRQQAQEELAGQSRTPQVEGDKSRDEPIPLRLSGQDGEG